MLITLLLLASKERTILISALFLIAAFPILMLLWNYETGWNFETLDYDGFWTLNGFIRNLLYNGFHPVIPWTAFMLIGYWFGKQDLYNDKFVWKAFWISTTIFISIQVLSYISISYLSKGNLETAKELTEILGTGPMPPLPIYMFNGIAIALSIISACIIFVNRFKNSFLVEALKNTGQMALTFYVAHVIIGMGIVETINPAKMGKYSIEFSVIYAITFSLICVFFAVIWRKHKKYGPLEWAIRKMTN